MNQYFHYPLRLFPQVLKRRCELHFIFLCSEINALFLFGLHNFILYKWICIKYFLRLKSNIHYGCGTNPGYVMYHSFYRTSDIYKYYKLFEDDLILFHGICRLASTSTWLFVALVHETQVRNIVFSQQVLSNQRPHFSK